MLHPPVPESSLRSAGVFRSQTRAILAPVFRAQGLLAPGPAFRSLPGAVPGPRRTPASLAGGGAFDGDQEGVRSPGVSLGPARGRVPAGVRLRPRAPGSLLPRRGPSAHLAAVKACQPLLGALHQLCREVLCSVLGSLGREPQRKRMGRRAMRLSGSTGLRGQRGRVGGAGTRRPGFGKTWSREERSKKFQTRPRGWLQIPTPLTPGAPGSPHPTP